MDRDALPEGWALWSDEPERSVLVYRPDVFDGGAFPAPCLPTIYLARGRRGRHPGRAREGSGWHVTLFLEPEVEVSRDRFRTREAAVEAALERARAFAVGELDYRAAYQVPRPDYLDRLDELTGRGT